jgi:hypothetical protein
MVRTHGIADCRFFMHLESTMKVFRTLALLGTGLLVRKLLNSKRASQWAGLDSSFGTRPKKKARTPEVDAGPPSR